MTLPQYFDQAGADLLEGLVQQAVLEGGLGVVATQGAGEVGDRGDQIGGADHFGQFVQQGDVLGQGLGRYGSSEVIDELAEHIGADLGDDVVQGGEVVEDRAAADSGAFGEFVHAEGRAAGGV